MSYCPTKKHILSKIAYGIACEINEFFVKYPSLFPEVIKKCLEELISPKDFWCSGSEKQKYTQPLAEELVRIGDKVVSRLKKIGIGDGCLYYEQPYRPELTFLRSNIILPSYIGPVMITYNFIKLWGDTVQKYSAKKKYHYIPYLHPPIKIKLLTSIAEIRKTFPDSLGREFIEEISEVNISGIVIYDIYSEEEINTILNKKFEDWRKAINIIKNYVEYAERNYLLSGGTP